MTEITETVCLDPPENGVEVLPEHSNKGGSGAERWMSCPGSSVLLAKLNLPQSDEPDYRRDGVAAHEVAAHCLTNNIDTWEVVGLKFHDTEVTQEMADAVQVYLNDVRQFSNYQTVVIEQSIGSDLPERPHPDFFGRLDFGAWGTDDIIIEDYKHGEGIVVEADENPQMMYYAYGFILRRIQINKVNVRSDRVVRLRICQPRAFHEDGPIREWTTTAGEIIHWGENVLIPAMERADFDTSFDCGKHCRFCAAKLFCPLLSGMFGAAARADATALPNFGQSRMSAEYDACKAVEFYVKAVKDEVLRRNMLGNTVPGTKLVLKKANRVWSPEAEPVFKERFGDEAFTKPELKSPAEMSKIGPVAKTLVSEYAFTPQTGLTVAPIGDPKPAIKVEKGVDIFAHLIDAGNSTANAT
jgi:hypothetical protein